MGIFLNVVDHEIFEYEKIIKKKPTTLMLDRDKFQLLFYEVGQLDFYQQKNFLYREFDQATHGHRNFYKGLRIVEMKIQNGGSCSWALGE